MSSTFLYLAIVAVWAVVLVPMWLRRDTRQHHKRADTPPADLPLDDTATDDDEPPAYQPPHGRRRGHGRAAVIARRRRRTSGLTLFVLLSVALTATGLAAWWAALPSVALLAGHLALLRVAVGIDAARRRDALARAHRARETAAPATDSPTAEVIELVVPEVFDQYADDRRAVGD